jgi:Ala-tRNA(Pro) deacylase
MPAKKLKAFLNANNIRYDILFHPMANTSQEKAAKVHISGKEFAKTVMVNINNKMAMTVLPASYQVDFDILKIMLGTTNIKLATEAEFKAMFPDCEPGAMPPFGNLYDMDVYVAESLTEDDEIAFNAGTHTELIVMNYEDYERLVNPKVFRFSWKTVAIPHDPAERWELDYY